MAYDSKDAAPGPLPPVASSRLARPTPPMHRLEERGAIRGYPARLNPELVGYPLTAFVSVILDHYLSEILKSIPGVARTRTTIVLATAKEAPLWPPAPARKA